MSESEQVADDPAGPTSVLARFAADARFEDLPEAVVQQAKQSVLDILGVALVGAVMNTECANVTRYCLLASGSGSAAVSAGSHATLWTSGEPLAPGYAALANAAHARALDYDDIIPFPQIHVAACVVPAAVAIAQGLTTGAGRALLSGVAVGCEIQARLAAAIAPYFGSDLPVMLASQVFGYFSAAAACGNIQKLPQASMHDAFGLALMHAAGTEETVVHTAISMGKYVYSGLSNQGGLQSALMAACGVQARGEVLIGTAGLFNAYFGGRYDRAALTDGLGQTYRSMTRCLKSMPGTLVAHAFVEAAAALVAQHSLQARQIARITLHVGPWGSVMCNPVEMRRHPPSATAAMNSIPYLVARMLAKGRIGIDDFDGAARIDPDVYAMAAKIEHIVDPDLARPEGLEPGIVTLFLDDGRSWTLRIDAPVGHPDRPLSFDDVAEKFRRNLTDANVSVSTDRIENMIESIYRLDTLDDLSSVFSSQLRTEPSKR